MRTTIQAIRERLSRLGLTRKLLQPRSFVGSGVGFSRAFVKDRVDHTQRSRKPPTSDQLIVVDVCCIEALPIKLSDIDFEERTIKISRSKTAAGRRIVPMMALCTSVLL